MKQKLFKKMILTATTFVMSTLLAAVMASAANQLTYLDFVYEIDGNGVIITEYNGNDSYVYIPDQIDGRDVTAIDDFAFRGNSSITAVRLPNTLEHIGTCSFAECENLERVVLPNSVQTIGIEYDALATYTFFGCSNLDTFVMGENINRIGFQFLGECSSLKQLSISEAYDDCDIFRSYDSTFSCLSMSDVYFRSTVTDIWSLHTDAFTYHLPSTEQYQEVIEDAEAYPNMNFDIEYTPLSDSHVKVTFDGNGGQIPDINGKLHNTTEILTLYGQPVSEERRPEKKDSEFVGWYDNKECKGEPWDFVFDEVSKDITLYAKYRPIQYTVTFDADGGKCDTKTKDYSFGLPMEDLPVPTRTNQNFVGWFTRPDGGGELYHEYTTMPRTDIKLYAAWLPTGRKLTVTYDANGGSCDKDKEYIDYNACIEELPTTKLKGYKFLGWNSNPDGSGEYYKSSTKVRYLDTTLYAVWEAKSYKLTLDANGLELKDSTRSVKYNSKIGNLPVLERAGYEFGGWYYSDGTKAKSTDKMPAKSVTLTAKWRGFEYMIIFDARSGKCDTETMFVCCGDNVGELPVPTRKGYVFQGWYTKAKCQGTKYTSTTEMPEKDITLYAGWKKASYATAVKLNKTAITLGVGQTYTVKATTTPKVSLDKLTWTTSNSNVATVSSTGKITAKSTGTAKITVTTTKGYKASITVTVKKAVTALKSAYYKRTLAVGQVATLKITSTGYAGVIAYTSNDTKVATVDKRGNITAVSKGTAIITVRAYNGVHTQITITVE